MDFSAAASATTAAAAATAAAVVVVLGDTADTEAEAAGGAGTAKEELVSTLEFELEVETTLRFCPVEDAEEPELEEDDVAVRF